MVATRNHPKDFEPPPTESPTKRSTRTSIEPTATASPTKRTSRTSSANHTAAPTLAASLPQTTPSRTRPSASSAPTRTPPSASWSHTPSNLTLLWLAISLPLVIWDTGYVVLRPLSMPGGALHSPIWKPYALYGTVDHVYGFKAWEAHNGWTLAQGSVNAVETVAYLVYLYVVYAYGQQEETQGRGAPDQDTMGRLRGLSESRKVYGRLATGAVLLGYSTAWLTFSKTVLYWLNEAFSGKLHRTGLRCCSALEANPLVRM